LRSRRRRGPSATAKQQCDQSEGHGEQWQRRGSGTSVDKPLTAIAPELSGKQLELLKEIVPKLTRVADFGSSTSGANAQSVKETELAAGALGVKLQYLDILGVLSKKKGYAGIPGLIEIERLRR
jgi:hypothetical protein